MTVKGFILGTVTLVALGTVLRADYGINRLQEGTNLFARGMKRLLAPDVAGIPNKSKGAAPSTQNSSASSSAVIVPARITTV